MASMAYYLAEIPYNEMSNVKNVLPKSSRTHSPESFTENKSVSLTDSRRNRGMTYKDSHRNDLQAKILNIMTNRRITVHN